MGQALSGEEFWEADVVEMRWDQKEHQTVTLISCNAILLKHVDYIRRLIPVLFFKMSM